MKFFLIGLAYFSQLSMVNASSTTHFDYDLTSDTNRWGLTKDCALKVHTSARDYCSQVFKSHKEKINCESPSFMMDSQVSAVTDQKRFTIAYPFIDTPRRSTLLYVSVLDAKNCIHNIKNL